MREGTKMVSLTVFLTCVHLHHHIECVSLVQFLPVTVYYRCQFYAINCLDQEQVRDI